MKKLLKIIAFTFAALCLMLLVAFLVSNMKPTDIKAKTEELKAYCARNGYNTDYAILVDYGRTSLQRRIFVYDFRQDKIVISSLAGHGAGGRSTVLRADFGNAHGSHCSSLGHYKVGRNRMMYNRPRVPAFELIGLDKTNSNAHERGILIHPSAWPLSWGCVTMPVHRYHQLSEFLKTQRNVIMWVYEK